MPLRDKSFQWKSRHLMVALVMVVVGLPVMVIVFSHNQLKSQVEQVGGTYDSYNLDLNRGSNWSLLTSMDDYLVNKFNGVERNSVNIGFSEKSSVTDEWFELNSSHLQKIPLHWLSLRKAPISDATVKALSGQPTLGDLNLEKTSISDESVASLLTLSNLHALNLIGTEISEAGLIRLLTHSKLRRLEINGELLSDELVSAMNSSPQVRELTMKSPSPAVITKAAQLKHIIGMSLSDVTDEDLPSLKQLHQLKILSLVDSTLSKSSIHQLKSDLPNVSQRWSISIGQAEEQGLYEQMERQKQLARKFYLVIVICGVVFMYFAFSIVKRFRTRRSNVI